MKLLLDTHALLWWLLDDPRLSPRVAAVLRDPDNSVMVSSASAWEIATKHRLGRLASAAPLLQAPAGVSTYHLTPAVAAATAGHACWRWPPARALVRCGG